MNDKKKLNFGCTECIYIIALSSVFAHIASCTEYIDIVF